MSQVKYRKCDVCGEKILKYGLYYRFKFYKNKIDICDTCLHKIEKLSEDIEEEQKVLDQAIKDGCRFINKGEQETYFQGVDDA